jgi:hypothetical protein
LELSATSNRRKRKSAGPVVRQRYSEISDVESFTIVMFACVGAVAYRYRGRATRRDKGVRFLVTIAETLDAQYRRPNSDLNRPHSEQPDHRHQNIFHRRSSQPSIFVLKLLRQMLLIMLIQMTP